MEKDLAQLRHEKRVNKERSWYDRLTVSSQLNLMRQPVLTEALQRGDVASGAPRLPPRRRSK